MIHNLDEGIVEYFEFKLLDHQYKFRHLNTDEVAELQKVGNDDTAMKKFLYQFITPCDEKSPAFADVVGKMLVPHWKNFKAMILAEFGQ